MKMNSKDIDL
jgi:ABC-type multidrug transport system fused ATPase/permease subunit